MLIDKEFYKIAQKEFQGNEKIEIIGSLFNYPKYFYDKTVKVKIVQEFIIDKITKIK